MISLPLTLALAAMAQSEGPMLEVAGALSAWGGCIEREASERASGSAPVETVADAALAACADSEREARAATVRQIGESRAAAGFARVRLSQREEAMTWARLARGEVDSQPALYRYGRCIGYNSAMFLPLREAPAILADRIRAACTADEPAALAELRRGDASANQADLDELRDSVIAQAVGTAAERRPRH